MKICQQLRSGVVNIATSRVHHLNCVINETMFFYNATVPALSIMQTRLIVVKQIKYSCKKTIATLLLQLGWNTM